MKAARRVVFEVVGWLLVVGGIIAMPLPGPGLLILAAGLFVLSRQYEWAERRVDTVLDRALISAAQGVEAWWKVAISVIFAFGVIGFGVVWILSPPVPDWWPVDDRWWLPGGNVTGITQIVSGVIALGLIVWSYHRYHGEPEAVAELRSRAARRAEARERTEAQEAEAESRS
jgi:hypothetical protein